MATAATILVSIQGDATGANRALKSAGAEMAVFQKGANLLGAGMLSVATAAGSLLASGIQSGIGAVQNLGAEFVNTAIREAEVIDNLGKLADRLGISSEAFSALDYAAGKSGISTEELGTSLTFMNKTLAKAEEGNKEAINTFAMLGLSVEDLESLSADEQLLKSPTPSRRSAAMPPRP